MNRFFSNIDNSDDDDDDEDKNDNLKDEENNYALQPISNTQQRPRRRRQNSPAKSSAAHSSSLQTSFLSTSPSANDNHDTKRKLSTKKINDCKKQQRQRLRLLGKRIKDALSLCNDRHIREKNRKKDIIIMITTIIFFWIAYQTWYVFSNVTLKRWRMMRQHQKEQSIPKQKSSDDLYINYHRQKEEEEEKIPMEYYKYIYNNSAVPPKYVIDKNHWSSFLHSDKEKENISYLTYASPDIVNHGCDVTIVLMDPNLPLRGFGHKIWFMLESVAEYVDYIDENDLEERQHKKMGRRNRECVLLQTSSCKITNRQTTRDTYNSDVQAVGNIVYEKSLPLFQRMMRRGQVRITILNHTKYNFKSCSNFFNPSSALMNIHYWKDEFVDQIDSDLVVTVQDDCVFCKALDPSRWKDVAYVGSPWSYANGFWHYVWHMWNPRRIFKLFHIFLMCDKMEEWWNDWISVENRGDIAQQFVRMHGRERESNSESHTTGPEQIDFWEEEKVSKNFPPVCNIDGYGAVGNGGLTIRSRKWLIKAIEICPHVEWSGIDISTYSNSLISCHATKKDINEDAYFATVLNGISAPMPKAFDASLFSVEMMWPEEVASIYGPWTEEEQMERIFHRWGLEEETQSKDGSNGGHGGTFNFDGHVYTVPIGMHKPWWYQPSEMLQSENFRKQCKFFEFMFQPKEYRWTQIGSGPIASWWQLKRYFRFLSFLS